MSWLEPLLGIDMPNEGASVALNGTEFVVKGGILRSKSLASEAQEQTKSTFGFKWKKVDTYTSPAVSAAGRQWLIERYGDVIKEPWFNSPLILDAGCGSAYSALLLFGDALAHARYLGVDISEAIDVARVRLQDRGLRGAFLQCDLNSIPLPAESVDIIFSEGVLHHTDSTERAFHALVPFLRQGGRFLFYVYRKKAPIREFTDDFLRAKLQGMTPEQAWTALEPLTKFGKALGDLNIEVEVPETVDFLQIPAGKHNLQRLFYWYIAKAFYRPDMTLDEMNHINLDWYGPKNAHRHSVEEVERWCKDAGLRIERLNVQEAGITVIAKRPG